MRLRPVPPTILAAALLCVCTVAPALAQRQPLTVEARGGVQVPLEAFRDPGRTWVDGAGSGASFGVDFAYAFSWYGAAYGGFSQHRYGCPASGCGRRTKLVGTGFDLGVRFILGTGPVVPWLRGGMISYRIEGTTPADGGAEEVTSSRAVGAEGGFGLAIHLNDRLTLTPGLRYTRMTPDFSGPGPLPVRSLVADVGLMLGF